MPSAVLAALARGGTPPRASDAPKDSDTSDIPVAGGLGEKGPAPRPVKVAPIVGYDSILGIEAPLPKVEMPSPPPPGPGRAPMLDLAAHDGKPPPPMLLQ